jgi:hypothetical protein
MTRKILSVRNPISYQICMGFKDIENRTWKTDYRGRIYIHSSTQYTYPVFSGLDNTDLWPPKIGRKITAYFKMIDTLTEEQKKLFRSDAQAEKFLTENGTYEKNKAAFEFCKLWSRYVDLSEKHYGIDLYKEVDPKEQETYEEKCKQAIKDKGDMLVNEAIIGYVDLVDIVENSKSPWAFPGNYHWILEHPVLFEYPVTGVKGKLHFFDVPGLELPEK